MNPERWLRAWEEGRIGFHEGRPNALLSSLWPELGLPAEATVLVPLCGKSVDLFWLAEAGHTVVGVELSALAVEQFFEEQSLRPERRPLGALEAWTAGPITILCGDVFDVGPAHLGPRGALGSVDALYDRAALIALPPDLRARYAQHLCQLFGASSASTDPRRCGLVITLTYGSGSFEGPPFSVTAEEVQECLLAAFHVEPLEVRGGSAEGPLPAHDWTALALRGRPSG